MVFQSYGCNNDFQYFHVEYVKKHKAIYCNLCNKQIDIGYSNLTKTTYIQIQHSDTNWFDMLGLKKEVHFNTITDMNCKKYTLSNTYSPSHLKAHKVLQKMKKTFYKMRQIIIKFNVCIGTQLILKKWLQLMPVASHCYI